MFESEQKIVSEQIRAFCLGHGIQLSDEIKWQPIPFSGEWGISMPIFPIAAQEARSGKHVNVPLRAQSIAEAICDYLGVPSGFSRVEAVRGYLNLYFETREYSHRVVETVLSQGENFGRGVHKDEQVMVEFSQPNTHKSFHVGHLRSAILGDAVCRILDFAGFDVVRSNYPGDMGLHVIKWMWNYMKHHAGENITTGRDRTNTFTCLAEMWVIIAI